VLCAPANFLVLQQPVDGEDVEKNEQRWARCRLQDVITADIGGKGEIFGRLGVLRREIPDEQVT